LRGHFLIFSSVGRAEDQVVDIIETNFSASFFEQNAINYRPIRYDIKYQFELANNLISIEDPLNPLFYEFSYIYSTYLRIFAFC
jgi:hypothetical protein